MDNKHYLIFSSDVSPGGISNMLAVHTLALLKINYRVTVLVPKDSDAINSINNILSLVKNGKKLLKIIEYTKSQFYYAKLSNKNFFKSIFSKIDGCFVHNARLIAFTKKYTTATLFAVNHTGKKSQIKYYKKADLVFSVNKTINEELISNGINDKKCFVCPNTLSELPAHSNKSKNNKDVCLVIGVIGRLVRKKGFEDFIEALKILKSRNKKFKAYIAGDGELLSHLKILSQEINEIKFLGWIKNKYKFYNEIDIFCQPSHFEPFGLTIIEAMSYGLPVVSTDCDGPKEIIKESSKYGFIVPINKPFDMANVLEDLLNDKNKRNRVGLDARKRVEKYYTIEKLQSLLSEFTKKYS